MSKIINVFCVLAFAAALTACADKAPVAAQQSAQDKTTNTQNIQEDAMQVLLKTNKGDIVLELDAKAAPESVENFIKYVKAGQYDGTIFHRVIKGFMVQGGGMDAQMNERQTRAPIVNEADNGLKNNKYTLAMARTSDPHSATAQFFINTNNNDFLNFRSQSTQGWGYAVFGKVVKGQDVVDAIESVATASRYPHDDVPVQAVVIEKAEAL